MQPIFSSFLQDRFHDAVPPVTTAAAAARHVTRTPEYECLRDALEQSTMSVAEVEQFTSQLLADYAPGVHLEHELVLVALVLAVGELWNPQATEYLEQVSRIRCAELPLLPGVAALLQERRGREPQQSP